MIMRLNAVKCFCWFFIGLGLLAYKTFQKVKAKLFVKLI